MINLAGQTLLLILLITLERTCARLKKIGYSWRLGPASKLDILLSVVKINLEPRIDGTAALRITPHFQYYLKNFL